MRQWNFPSIFFSFVKKNFLEPCAQPQPDKSLYAVFCLHCTVIWFVYAPAIRLKWRACAMVKFSPAKNSFLLPSTLTTPSIVSDSLNVTHAVFVWCPFADKPEKSFNRKIILRVKSQKWSTNEWWKVKFKRSALSFLQIFSF